MAWLLNSVVEDHLTVEVKGRKFEEGREQSRPFLFGGVGDNLILRPVVMRRRAEDGIMTLDEMDRKIEFILQMQAQFEANLARSEANIDNLRVSVSDLRVTVADLAGVVRESIRFSDDRFARFDQVMMELAEAQKTTDERLNALISVVERHITGPDHAARP
jgi:hypothetical protein